MRLGLEGNYVGDAGVTALSKALVQNTTLKRLNLNSNEITEDGIKALVTSLEVNSTLSWLGLDNNEIGEGGSRLIADFLGSDRSRSLQRLHLIDAHIGDAGVALIAQALKGQKSLHMLLIGANSVTSTGMTAIAEMLRENSTLNMLEVDSFPTESRDALALHHPVAIECSLGLRAIGEALRDVPRPKVKCDHSLTARGSLSFSPTARSKVTAALPPGILHSPWYQAMKR